MTRERPDERVIKYFSRLVAEISEYLGRTARSRLDRDGNEKSLRRVSTSAHCPAAVTPVPSPSRRRSFLTWKKKGSDVPLQGLRWSTFNWSACDFVLFVKSLRSRSETRVINRNYLNVRSARLTGGQFLSSADGDTWKIDRYSAPINAQMRFNSRRVFFFIEVFSAVCLSRGSIVWLSLLRK